MSEGQNKTAKKQKTLGKYITIKLGITLALFAEEVSIQPRTLYVQWETKKGRINICNSVFSFYANSSVKGRRLKKEFDAL